MAIIRIQRIPVKGLEYSWPVLNEISWDFYPLYSLLPPPHPFLGAHHVACWTLVPWLGIECRPMAVGPNHWITRGILTHPYLNSFPFLFLVSESLWAYYGQVLISSPVWSLLVNILIAPCPVFFLNLFSDGTDYHIITDALYVLVCLLLVVCVFKFYLGWVLSFKSYLYLGF